jgi:hypothetical protein
MGRLIEIPPSAQGFPSSLTVEVGDVLVFGATGGQVRSGGDAVEVLGALLTAVLGDDGRILSPSGAPNTVLFLARRCGRARIDVVTGDPWRTSQTIMLDLTVEPPAEVADP